MFPFIEFGQVHPHIFNGKDKIETIINIASGITIKYFLDITYFIDIKYFLEELFLEKVTYINIYLLHVIYFPMFLILFFRLIFRQW